MTKRERNGEALEGPVAVAAVVPHQQGGGRDEGAQKKDHEDGVGGQIHGTGGQEVYHGGDDLPADDAGSGVSTASPMGRAKRSTVKIQKYNMI